MRFSRTPKTGLCLMEVGDRSDCLDMDIVRGKDSLLETLRKHKYTLTMNDSFTRFTAAISFVDQSSSVLIFATIGNYITIYDTTRRILTDHNFNFKSIILFELSNFFQLFKFRTISYRRQYNGWCEKFNQTLKCRFCKVLHESPQ